MLWLVLLTGCSSFGRYEFLYQIGGVGSVEGQGRVDAVATVPGGLFLAETRDPAQPRIVHTLVASTPVVLTRTASAELPFDVLHIEADDTWAVAAGGLGGLAILRADPEDPEVLWDGVIGSDDVVDIAVGDGILWATTGMDLTRVDIAGFVADPDAVDDWVVTRDLDTPIEGLTVSDGVLWTLSPSSAGTQTIRSVDAATLASTGVLRVDGGPPVEGILVHAETLYAGTARTLRTADIRDVAAPVWTDVELERSGGVPMQVRDGIVWTVREAAEFDVIDLVDTDGPRGRGHFEGTCVEVLDLEVADQTFYVACREGGLRVFADTSAWDDE